MPDESPHAAALDIPPDAPPEESPGEPPDEPPDESPDDGAVRDVTVRLETAYRDRCSPEQVSAAVSAAFEKFKDSRIRDFVPVLAERSARVALDGQARAGQRP
ncbi:three-helix bundle dimerization domain-containing protein [Streptacidiphilus anmyonensis]|uniref:three-helix bundle dimerization domain-containing protein n=1 Tax=Streptacidiphilus anmyonensis TaxID=405782 RepID=UPI0013922BC1|nr:hypothetical protein [Streptacidiphilus anmyonensis]